MPAPSFRGSDAGSVREAQVVDRMDSESSATPSEYSPKKRSEKDNELRKLFKLPDNEVILRCSTSFA
jgi:hypothetical protein